MLDQKAAPSQTPIRGSEAEVSIEAKDPTVRERIRKAVDPNMNETVRRYEIACLGNLPPGSSDAQAVVLTLGKLADHPQLFGNALEALKDLSQQGSYVALAAPEIIRRMQHPTPGIARYATKCLDWIMPDLKGPVRTQALNAFLALTKEGVDSEVRQKAVFALRYFRGDKQSKDALQARKALLGLIKDKDWVTRGCAGVALVHMDDSAEELATLIEDLSTYVVRSKDAVNREEAAAFLRQIAAVTSRPSVADAAIAGIIPMLTDSSPRNRRRATSLLRWDVAGKGVAALGPLQEAAKLEEIQVIRINILQTIEDIQKTNQMDTNDVKAKLKKEYEDLEKKMAR